MATNAGMKWFQDKQYVYFGPATYLLLDDNSPAAALQAKLPGVVDKYVAPAVPPLFGESGNSSSRKATGIATSFNP